MKPGLPTITALMLAAIVAVWLGVLGPLDLSRLKEWQTLTSALVALIAAGVAYVAAIAKVNFDRAVHEAAQQRQKRNILLKVQYAALIFRGNLMTQIKRLDPPIRGISDTILAKDMALPWPPEFEQAWDNLDLFTRPAAEAVTNIKYNRQFLERAVEHLDQSKQYQFTWSQRPPEITAVYKLMMEVYSYVENLLASL